MPQKIRDYLKYILPFTLGVLIFALITNYMGTMTLLWSVTDFLLFLLNKFIIGFGLAYIINIFVEWMMKSFRFPRWLGVTVSLLIFFGAIVWIIFFISPLIYDSIQQVLRVLPEYYGVIRDFLSNIAQSLSPEEQETILGFVSQFTDGLISLITRSFDLSSIQDLINSSARAIIDLMIGLVVMFYALIGKENIVAAGRRAVFAIFKKERAESLSALCRGFNHMFSKFIVGKVIDSLIIGVTTFILFTIFGLPLTPFLALIAGIFTMIPYFGPWIGMIVTAVILLCFNPVYVLYALAVFGALQLVDNLVIGPKLIGTMVGISPLLTIFAISVCGDIAGFLGMFLGIPLFAGIKAYIIDPFIKRRQRAEGRGQIGDDDGGGGDDG